MNFESLPRPIRSLAYTLGGVRNYFYRYGPEYYRFRKFLRESEYWDKEKREEWQISELKKLLREVKGNSNYYKKEWKQEIKKALQQNSISEMLSALPVLDKETLKNETEDIYNSARWGILTKSTSGSTGSPLRFKYDWASKQRLQAIKDDHVTRCGIKPADRSIRLSGHLVAATQKKVDKPWLFNPVENQLFLSTYHLKQEYVKVIAGKVQNYQPVRIDGYPSAILQLLRICNEENIELRKLQLIITTAETLTGDVRSEIEKLSGATVCDYYSASEGIPFIQQCTEGTYHVRWQTGMFQVLDDDEIKDEGTGVAICTSFIQYKTPLIRYKIGDVLSNLKVPQQQCSCGMKGKTIDGIVGRVEDLVLTRDGRSIGMFTYRTLKNVTGLKEAQVIQEDYEKFRVNCVLSNGVDKDAITKKIADKFTRAIGTESEVELNTYKSLPRGANGKLRTVISKLHSSQK